MKVRFPLKKKIKIKKSPEFSNKNPPQNNDMKMKDCYYKLLQTTESANLSSMSLKMIAGEWKRIEDEARKWRSVASGK